MLSQNAIKALQIACPQNRGSTPGAAGTDGQEIANAIDTGFNATPAADVAANSPASADTIALSTSDTYTDAAVNTAVNAALATAIADLNATRTQINAILTALKNAGLMS